MGPTRPHRILSVDSAKITAGGMGSPFGVVPYPGGGSQEPTGA